MLRVLLWFGLIYLVWKVIRIISVRQRSRYGHFGHMKSSSQSTPPFSDIQDAEFEDVDPKKESNQPKQDS